MVGAPLIVPTSPPPTDSPSPIEDDGEDSDSDWSTISEEMDRIAQTANGDVHMMAVLPGVKSADCAFPLFINNKHSCFTFHSIGCLAGNGRKIFN